MCFEESKKSNLNCNILILIKINGIIYPIQSTTPWSPQCLLLLNPLTPRYLSEPCFAKCNIGDNWFPAYGPRTTFHTHFITRVSQGPERTRLVSFLHTLTQFAYEICTPPLYRVYLPLCTPICNGICHPLVNIDPSRFTYNTTGFFEGIFLSLLALKNCQLYESSIDTWHIKRKWGTLLLIIISTQIVNTSSSCLKS